MRLSPTLNGGLRIDVEEQHDWEALRWIGLDANPEGLAHQLTQRSGEVEDWEEFIMPELEETFSGQARSVSESIEEAARNAEGGPGPLFIGKEEAELWYGALNQARLTLHGRHDFSDDAPPEDDMAVPKRAAYYRYQFYMALQEVLLTRVMMP